MARKDSHLEWVTSPTSLSFWVYRRKRCRLSMTYTRRLLKSSVQEEPPPLC